MSKKLTKCPNCEGKVINEYSSVWWMHFDRCTSCTWNAIPENVRVTKERYKLCCRLTRLRFQPVTVHPLKATQPTDILTMFMSSIYGQVVPYHLRSHLEHATGRWTRVKAWYWDNHPSRWEYHHMLAEGTIKTWKEYEQFYKERREWENQPDDSMSGDSSTHGDEWYEDEY